MVNLKLTDVHVDLPIFTSRSRGLLNSIFRYAQRERARVEAVGVFSYQVHALRGIDLDIRDGDRLGLVGRNGAGKTTLLRVLSGAYEPTRGEISIDGTVIGRVTPDGLARLAVIVFEGSIDLFGLVLHLLLLRCGGSTKTPDAHRCTPGACHCCRHRT